MLAVLAEVPGFSCPTPEPMASLVEEVARRETAPVGAVHELPLPHFTVVRTLIGEP
jgi:hypothetical protein